MLSALVGAFLLAATSQQVLAFSFLGITLFEDQKSLDASAVIADPQAYGVSVEVSPANVALEAAVQNASALWRDRDKPASGAAGLLASARTDYRRIVAALYADGYYGGTVSILVDGAEANDLAPDASLGDPANVQIRVQTGDQFRFGAIEIVNQAPATLDESDVVAAPSSAGLSTGEVARSGAIKRAARLAVEAWHQLGYAKAKIAGQDIVADHRLKVVNVSLVVEPGPSATIGSITIEGTVDMNADFVVRQTGLVTGQAYDPDDIAQAKKRLSALNVFGVVTIKEAKEIQRDGSLPLTIIVQERKQQRVGVGATYSSTDGVGIEGFWQHRNLFGGAERLRLDAKLAGIGFPVKSADFDYYFGGTFTKPGILTPDSNLIASLNAQHTVLTNYTETSVEGRLGLSQTFSNEFAGELGIGAKRANFWDATHGERNFSVWSSYGALTYDTRDDPSKATGGLFASVAAEPFYESEYGNAALLLETEGRSYMDFGSNGDFVLAARLKMGFLIGPSIAQTPPDKLFFAGGGGSVRGFSYRSIGVEGPGGSVTGGKFLTEASVEARARITQDIGVVGFVDAGYVTADTFVGLATGTRIGVGAGLRYNTGFGPIRLDGAIPLNKRPGDPDYGLYVGIGQAF